MTDGPYVEAKEIIVSFAIIQADDYDAARGDRPRMPARPHDRDPRIGRLRMSEPRALVEHFFRHEFGRLGSPGHKKGPVEGGKPNEWSLDAESGSVRSNPERLKFEA